MKTVKRSDSPIPVDKNIPVPSVKRPKHKYPFDDMEPGDSFFIPTESIETTNIVLTRLRSAIAQRGLRGLGKYSVYRVDGGVRIWFNGIDSEG